MTEIPYDLDFSKEWAEKQLNSSSPSIKKKKNSKAKGNRVELELAKILTAHFAKPFERSVGSGNRWSQVNQLSKAAKEVFLGDLCPPEGFKWVIECKGGYENKIDFNNLGPIAQIDSFIQQSTDDAKRSEKLPIIFWKQSRKPWLTLVLEENSPSALPFFYRIHYRNWIVLPMKELLQITDISYWFE